MVSLKFITASRISHKEPLAVPDIVFLGGVRHQNMQVLRTYSDELSSPTVL